MQNTNSFAPDDSTRSTTQGKSAKNILPIEEKNQVPPDVNLFHLVAKLSSTLVDQAVAPDPETTKNTLTRLHTVLPEAFKHATNSHKDVEDAKDAVSAYMRLVDYLLLLASHATTTLTGPLDTTHAPVIYNFFKGSLMDAVITAVKRWAALPGQPHIPKTAALLFETVVQGWIRIGRYCMQRVRDPSCTCTTADYQALNISFPNCVRMLNALGACTQPDMQRVHDACCAAIVDEYLQTFQHSVSVLMQYLTHQDMQKKLQMCRFSIQGFLSLTMHFPMKTIRIMQPVVETWAMLSDALYPNKTHHNEINNKNTNGAAVEVDDNARLMIQSHTLQNMAVTTCLWLVAMQANGHHAFKEHLHDLGTRHPLMVAQLLTAAVASKPDIPDTLLTALLQHTVKALFNRLGRHADTIMLMCRQPQLRRCVGNAVAVAGVVAVTRGGAVGVALHGLLVAQVMQPGPLCCSVLAMLVAALARHGGCNTCPRLHDLLLRVTLAELDVGPLIGPSDVRRQLRTLACVAGGAMPTHEAVLQQITTLLQACPPLEGPGAAAQAWAALATARGMLPPPNEHLSRLVVHDLLPKLFHGIDAGVVGLGGCAAHPLLPLHMAWLLEALREALQCILESQNDVLTSNCQRASTIVHQLLTMCNNTQAPPVYGRAALLLMLVLPLRVQAPLVGTHADMLVQWHASTKQVRPVLAELLPACAALPQPVQPLFFRVLEEQHWLLQHLAIRSMLRYSKEDPPNKDHVQLLPPSIRPAPNGDTPPAAATFKRAFLCYLQRTHTSIPPTNPSHTPAAFFCRTPTQHAAWESSISTALTGRHGDTLSTLQQLAKVYNDEGLMAVVEAAARALQRVQKEAHGADEATRDAVRKRLKAVVEGALGSWFF